MKQVTEKASNLATGCKSESAAEQNQAVASAFVACSVNFHSWIICSTVGEQLEAVPDKNFLGPNTGGRFQEEKPIVGN